MIDLDSLQSVETSGRANTVKDIYISLYSTNLINKIVFSNDFYERVERPSHVQIGWSVPAGILLIGENLKQSVDFKVIRASEIAIYHEGLITALKAAFALDFSSISKLTFTDIEILDNLATVKIAKL